MLSQFLFILRMRVWQPCHILVRVRFLFTVRSPEDTSVSVKQMCSDRDRRDRTDGQTDRRTDRQSTNLKRVMVTPAVYPRLVSTPVETNARASVCMSRGVVRARTFVKLALLPLAD